MTNSLDKIEAKKELYRRELAKRHMGDFVKYTMPVFESESFHPQFFDALERIEKGELKKLIVQLPPRAGKSEIISKRFPAWYLGRHPEKNIVCASYADNLAVDFGRKTMQILKTQRYKNVFEIALADDKKEAGNWETSAGGGYYSVGVGGGLTGRGFDIGIIDDPVKNREEAESLVIREKVWDWYTSTFLTRRQGSDSAVIILMTRWNVDDLVGRILELEPDDWEILNFPAVRTIDNKEVPLCNRSGFGLEFYKSQEEAIGVRDFAALYQQDPIASTGETFKKEDFRYYALSDLNPADFESAIYIDPAFSSRQDSDDTAIAVIARHKTTKDLYILDIFAEPILPSVAQDMAISWMEKWKQWNTRYISCEEVSISQDQQLFIKGLDSKMRELGKFYTLLPFKPQGKGKKEDRIRYSLEPVFNRHALFFRSDDQGNKAWRKLEEQLLKFPASPKDDLADVVSQGVIVWGEKAIHDKNRKHCYPQIGR